MVLTIKGEIYLMSDKPNGKADVLKRLRRIEGQIKGIQRMVEEEQNCVDIITQVSAAKAAINKAALLIMEMHSLSCIENALSSEDKDAAVEELIKTFSRFIKFSE